MGSIGMGEILLLLGIALVVIGPDKFPEFAKIVMRTIRDFRGYMTDVKQEIAKELRPVDEEVRKLSRLDPETLIDTLANAADEGESVEQSASSAPASDAADGDATDSADYTGKPEEPLTGHSSKEYKD